MIPITSPDDYHTPLIFPPQNPPPFLFHEDDLPLNQIFFQTHLMTPPEKIRSGDDPPPSSEKASPRSRTSLGVVPRRRPGKKDRHSKICTAHGVRDRRMRLSLQVARKFFDLQDLLGFDKASKTIEWLFTKSRKAIKELTRITNFKNSDCEAADRSSDGNTHPTVATICVDQLNNWYEKKQQDKTRESRVTARARSRTRGKMVIDKSSPKIDDNDLQNLGFSSNPQFDYHSNTQDRVIPPYGAVQELYDLGAIEKLLTNTASASPSLCPISDYLCSAADTSSWLGFPGNWDMVGNPIQQAPLMAENPSSIYLAAMNFP